MLKFNRVGGLWPAMKIVNICEAASIGNQRRYDAIHQAWRYGELPPRGGDPGSLPDRCGGALCGTRTRPFAAGWRSAAGRQDKSAPGFGVEIDEEKLAAMTIGSAAPA